MVLNTGYISVESSNDDGTITARIYYDSTVDPSQPQPLINGPKGYCLELINTGVTRKVKYTLPSGVVNSLNVPTGNPVRNRSLTATQLASQGYQFRSDVIGLTIE